MNLDRRALLRAALAAAAVAPLAACTDGDGPRPTESPAGSGSATATASAVDPQNPFGLASPATVAVAVFDGGFGTGYAEFAATQLSERREGVEVRVEAVRRIASEFEDEFSDGTPPDVVDNSGSGQLVLSEIVEELTDLSGLLDAENLEGEVIRETLYAKALDPGTIDDRVVAVNYALTVYGLWYSAALFEEQGWAPPETWDEALELGAKAKEAGKFLFLWGSEAADYFLEMCLASAIKEGGHGVRKAVDSLGDKCWSLPQVQEVFEQLAECVERGYVKPGGSGTEFLTAQAAWSLNHEALLYPCGSWIENEMRSRTAVGFRMTAAPVPTLTTSSSLPYAAVHSSASESFLVPKRAANVPGGMEYLRTLLSREAASHFARETLSPTVVKGTVPADAFGSTALASQIQLLGDAGEDVFSWKFHSYYGLGPAHRKAFNSFLEGQSDVAELTKALQDATDDIRRDGSIKKYEVE